MNVVSLSLKISYGTVLTLLLPVNHGWHHSLNTMAATSAFWLCCQNTGRYVLLVCFFFFSFLSFFFFFESLWVLCSVHSLVFSKCPVALPHSSSVTLSFRVLCPGASFAFCACRFHWASHPRRAQFRGHWRFALDGIFLLNQLFLLRREVAGASVSGDAATLVLTMLFSSKVTTR